MELINSSTAITISDEELIVTFKDQKVMFGYFLVFAGTFSLIGGLLTQILTRLSFSEDEAFYNEIFNVNIWKNADLSTIILSIFVVFTFSLILFFVSSIILIKIHEKFYGFVFVDQIQAISFAISFAFLFVTSFFDLSTDFSAFFLYFASIVYLTYSRAILSTRITTIISKANENLQAKAIIHYPLIGLINKIEYVHDTNENSELRYSIAVQSGLLPKKSDIVKGRPNIRLISPEEFEHLLKREQIATYYNFVLISARDKTSNLTLDNFNVTNVATFGDITDLQKLTDNLAKFSSIKFFPSQL